MDEVGKADALESSRVRNFLRNSCGCKLGPKGNACSTQFAHEAVIEQRENCAMLEKEALDMLILGQFQAHSSTTESDGTNRQHYIAFYYSGKHICRNFFLFIHSISLKRYRNLLEHHHKHGSAQRVHGNKHRAPHNRLPLDAIYDQEKSTATATKRKRACSHCRKEGHTKTKKGKITCPELM